MWRCGARGGVRCGVLVADEGVCVWGAWGSLRAQADGKGRGRLCGESLRVFVFGWGTHVSVGVLDAGGLWCGFGVAQVRAGAWVQGASAVVWCGIGWEQMCGFSRVRACGVRYGRAREYAGAVVWYRYKKKRGIPSPFFDKN